MAGILEGGGDAGCHDPRLAVADRLEPLGRFEDVVEVVERLVVAQPDFRGLCPQLRLLVLLALAPLLGTRVSVT